MEGAKKTKLYDIHKNLNGNIIDYHGVYLPVFYSSIHEEHNAVRNDAGIFDVSHMGIIGAVFMDKNNAIEKFNYIFANDFSKIIPGKVIYSTMLDNNGCVIDDLLVMSLSENEYFIIVNFPHMENDFNWIKSNISDANVKLENLSLNNGIIALQGPKACHILHDGLKFNVDRLKTFEVMKSVYDNKDLVISRTGYTGENGFEIFVDNSSIEKLFMEIINKGKQYNLKPCGLGCRDTLRLEAGLPLYGQELDLNHTPLQSMISWSVKLNKASDFIGKKSLLNFDTDKFSETMIGFEVLAKSIPRTGMEIINEKNEKIGYVTSGSISPTTKKNIGIAYVKKEYESNDNLFIRIRNKTEKISIIRLPFYKRSIT